MTASGMMNKEVKSNVEEVTMLPNYELTPAAF